MIERAKRMIPAAAAAAAFFLILGSCKPAEKPAAPPAVDEAGRPIVQTTGEVRPAQDSLGLVDALPELVALKCAGADRYRFQISGDDSFALVLYDRESDGNALVPADCDTLLAGARYFWRVMARKGATWGPWSKPADFSLAPAPTEGAVPETGTTIREAAPRLAWPAIPGAAAYDLRIALAEEGLASASPVRAAAADYAFPERLRNFSTVFWQFRAVAESGAPGGWSSILSFTLRWNPDIYAVYPPNGRAVPQSTPVLEWSAAPEAIAYVLQIAESSSEFDPLSWVDTSATSHRIEAEIPDKQSIQWRVRAKSAQGLYGAWQGPWTFTVEAGAAAPPPFTPPVSAPEPAPPAAAPAAEATPPVLVVPAPVPTLPLEAPRLEPQAPTAPIALLSPAEASILGDTTPAFDWEDVAGAFAYGFQLAGDPGFSWIISDTYSLGTSDYSQRKALDIGATYYWRVSFKMEDGAWSAWSSERSFRVEWSPAISATYPADGAKIPESRPTLSWSPVAGAFSYELQLAEGPSGFDAAASIMAARPSYRPTSAYANLTTRYWRVRPENNDGAFGAWQGPWRFTVELPRPQLSSPAEGASLEDVTPSFAWTEVKGAAGYRFQLASDPGFEDIIEDEVDLRGLNYTQPTALDNGKRFFWRVRAKDGEGIWSSWTPARTLTIDWKPSIAAIYPPDGARIPDSRPILAWSAAAGSTGYELQIADSPAAFGSARSIATDAPSYQPGAAYANSTVRVWRVRAKNADGAFGPWAGPWVFSISIARPSLAEPADAAVLSDSTPVFRWNEVPGASAYRFQLSTDTSFENIAISANNLTAPTYSQWEPLKNGQRYYWRVMARDEDGIWGSWTETRSLTVDWNPLISAIYPEPEGTIADATPLLDWSDVPGGVRLYELQLADTDRGFDSASSIAAASSAYQVTQAVPNGAVKFWRVRARNADGLPSAWQGPWSFSVAWNPAISVLAPPDAGTAAEAAPLLDWSDAPEAVSYQLQMASSVDIIATAPLIAVSQSQYQIESELFSPAKIYWRVRARNVDGIFGNWLGPWSFRAAARPPAPPPPPVATGAPLSVKLTGVPSRIYDEAIATAKALVSPAPDSSAWTLDGQPVPDADATSLLLAGSDIERGQHNLTYTARLGGTIVSASVDFEKVSGAMTARLESPTDGTVFYDPSPSFDWTDRAEADVYRIQIAADPGFKTIAAEESGIPASSFTPKSGLASGRTYHWRIAWRVSGTWSPWTDSFSFSIPLPKPPAAKAPADKAVLTAAQPSFSWEAAVGAASYEIALARNAAALDSAQIRAVNGTTWPSTSELSYGQWVWRVRSVDSFGNKGDWGETRRVHRSLLELVEVRGGTVASLGGGMSVGSFSMGKYEVTQKQYQLVAGSWSGSFLGDTSRPAEQLTWYDAVEFCNKLSALEGFQPVYSLSAKLPATGHPITSATVVADWDKDGYRLPTEAEWEWAARGGAASRGYAYSGGNALESVGWFANNSEGSTRSVGSKTPNELGLFDMSGNVWEWCWDWFDNLPRGAQVDYKGAEAGTARVARGGGWNNSSASCGVSARNSSLPGNRSSSSGLRVVRTLR